MIKNSKYNFTKGYLEKTQNSLIKNLVTNLQPQIILVYVIPHV